MDTRADGLLTTHPMPCNIFILNFYIFFAQFGHKSEPIRTNSHRKGLRKIPSLKDKARRARGIRRKERNKKEEERWWAG